MASPKIEVVQGLKNCCFTCGEGPHWDVKSKCLYYVDIIAGGVAKWNSVTGETRKYNFDGEVGFAIPCDRGGVVFGRNQDLLHLDFDTGATTKLADADAGLATRFNDAKCDASGRLWAGTMGLETDTPGKVTPGQGSLYTLSADHKIVKQHGGIDLSNGMDWTDDNKTMYFIDSVPRKVYAFDFDLDAGTVSNQRTVVEFAEGTMPLYGLPDGMTIDNEGKIWVACFSSSKVHRFDPETGKSIQTLEFPATNITSVCFGGENFEDLYVTCSRHNVKNVETQPLAGTIFKVTGLGVKGRAPNNFKG